MGLYLVAKGKRYVDGDPDASDPSLSNEEQMMLELIDEDPGHLPHHYEEALIKQLGLPPLDMVRRGAYAVDKNLQDMRLVIWRG